MSTRANIIFLDEYSKDGFDEFKFSKVDEESPCIKDSVIVYKHSSMHPDDALPVLHKFLNIKGAKSRGDDCEYLSAWYVAYLVNNMIKYNLPVYYEEYCSEEFMNAKRGNEDIEECEDFTGVGICRCIHGDISYLYIVEYVSDDNSFNIYVYDSWDGFIKVVNTNEPLDL